MSGRGQLSVLIASSDPTGTVPGVERVTLEELSPTSSATGAALLLSFTITQLHLVKSVRVDIEEQDSNFVALQTHNYSLSEAAYREGEACVSALSEGAHYLVCLRVNYSDIGEDSSCSRVGPVERGTVVTDKCFLPTSSRRVTDSGGSTGTSSETSAPVEIVQHTHTYSVHKAFC